VRRDRGGECAQGAHARESECGGARARPACGAARAGTAKCLCGRGPACHPASPPPTPQTPLLRTCPPCRVPFAGPARTCAHTEACAYIWVRRLAHASRPPNNHDPGCMGRTQRRAHAQFYMQCTAYTVACACGARGGRAHLEQLGPCEQRVAHSALPHASLLPQHTGACSTCPDEEEARYPCQ